MQPIRPTVQPLKPICLILSNLICSPFPKFGFSSSRSPKIPLRGSGHLPVADVESRTKISLTNNRASAHDVTSTENSSYILSMGFPVSYFV